MTSPKYWLRPPGFYVSRFDRYITVTYLTGARSGVQYNRSLSMTPKPGFNWLNWNCVSRELA
ncbi:MAG: hypothetical protein GYA36_19040 [Veillonellaceae bacterium]|nr:hypothetical protein [Veillonellaceae bacterium]